jgi:hypothetical protein
MLKIDVFFSRRVKQCFKHVQDGTVYSTQIFYAEFSDFTLAVYRKFNACWVCIEKHQKPIGLLCILLFQT